MTIKYSAENFTASFACCLKPGKKFLLTKKQTKLKVVKSIKEYDEQSVLVCFDEDKKVTLNNNVEVYIFNDQVECKPKIGADHDLVDELKRTPPIDIYGASKLYNIPLLLTVVLVPLVILFWWLFDSNKNNRDA
ncbi:MAG: hypothetical protein ACTHMM_13380 [Agriterribacter sp.]